MAPDLTDCLRYLRAHGIPIPYARKTAQELSIYIAQRGWYFAPETLLEAARQLGYPTKTRGDRILVGLAIRKPPTTSK